MSNKGHEDKKKIDWIPVILFVFTLIFSLCGYAYTKDMGYLRESITQIRMNQERAIQETKEKYEKLESRVRTLEIKSGG